MAHRDFSGLIYSRLLTKVQSWVLKVEWMITFGEIDELTGA